VPQSLILQMTRFGMMWCLAHPPEFKLMPDIMEQARENARKYKVGFEVITTWMTGRSRTPTWSTPSRGARW
jgi:ornithine carbamoyltransferase